MFAIVRKLDFCVVGQSPRKKDSEDFVYIKISDDQYTEFLGDPRLFRSYRATTDGSGLKLVKVPKLVPDLASPIDLPRHIEAPSHTYTIYVSADSLWLESSLAYTPPLTLVATENGDYVTAITLVLELGTKVHNPFSPSPLDLA